jgi:hypothetical protein
MQMNQVQHWNSLSFVQMEQVSDVGQVIPPHEPKQIRIWRPADEKFTQILLKTQIEKLTSNQKELHRLQDVHIYL